MNLELNNKQFRRLLDLVYIGNWILNSTRGEQRFADYDEVESLVFGKALMEGMPALAEIYHGEIVPSQAFVEGGIHEAIMEYENNVFFDILAEDLARRDFTVNAMALDENGMVIDRYGGQMDLFRNVIRCVGDPDRRFAEDALRMLRAVRFAAQLGFSIEKGTLDAIRRSARRAEKLSGERIKAELEKIREQAQNIE